MSANRRDERYLGGLLLYCFGAEVAEGSVEVLPAGGDVRVGGELLTVDLRARY